MESDKGMKKGKQNDEGKQNSTFLILHCLLMKNVMHGGINGAQNRVKEAGL